MLKSIQCPLCSKQFNFKNAYIGMKLKCTCDHVFDPSDGCTKTNQGNPQSTAKHVEKRNDIVLQRISRTGFWSMIIPLPIIGFFVLQMDFQLQTGAWRIAPPGPALLFYWTLFSMFVIVAICIRRIRDRNKSAWWVLICIIPYIGALWALIDLGLLRGTRGPNRFGPDPHNQ